MYIVTGTKTGLGQYLSNELNAIKYYRGVVWEDFVKKVQIDQENIIIHSAFNLSREVSSENYNNYIADTIGLTQKLCSLPNKKFIFISTVDVYPKGKTSCKEDMVFDVNTLDGVYARTKLICEEIVRSQSLNYLILRPAALFGCFMRKNSVVKLLDNNQEKLSLAKNSSFNIVLYEDILTFIKKAIDHNLGGTFNIASSSNITLNDLVKEFDLNNVSFGSFVYQTNEINNSKAVKILPRLSETSLESLKRFKAE